jgi:hypothetical protein
MHTKQLYLIALLIITGSYTSLAQKSKLKQKTGNASSDWYFKPEFKKGETFGNIYSRAIAYSGDGFTDLVQRVSGSSTYTVIDNNYLKPVFTETDLYDGRPESKGTATIEASGKGSYDEHTFVNTSASGLLYSELVWGKLPAVIHEGDSWTVAIKQPWELGGPGMQTITVMQMDEKHHTIMLKREGSSEGFYDRDAKQLTVTTKDDKKIKMDLTPGISHWTGYTIFKNGVVISDELLVTRPISLKTDSLNFSGKQREYILLNAMPVD